MTDTPRTEPETWQQRIDSMSDDEFNAFVRDLDRLAASRVESIRARLTRTPEPAA